MERAFVVGGTGIIGRELIVLLLADERYYVIALVTAPEQSL